MINIKKIVLTINNRDRERSVEEAKELNSILKDLFKEPEKVKEKEYIPYWPYWPDYKPYYEGDKWKIIWYSSNNTNGTFDIPKTNKNIITIY